MQKLKPDFEIALLAVTTARNMWTQRASAARKLLWQEAPTALPTCQLPFFALVLTVVDDDVAICGAQ